MSAGPSVPGATDALKRFELENNISEIDQIYSYDNAEQQQHLQGNHGGRPQLIAVRVRGSAEGGDGQAAGPQLLRPTSEGSSRI